MELAEQLELIAHGLTAVLATWLGLTVAVRAPRQPGARIFSLLTIVLVLWSGSIVVQRLTESAAVRDAVHPLEIAAAYLLVPMVLHIAFALTVEGRPSRAQSSALLGAYAIAAIVAAISLVNPALEPRVTGSPQDTVLGVPSSAIGWAWIAARVAIFLAAIGWIALALRGTGPDVARRRQLTLTLLTVVVATIGAIVRFTPPMSDTDPWLGVSLIAVSMSLATYAVFAQGVFFTPSVANRAFRYSIAVGLAVTAAVVVMLVIDSGARELLAIDLPIVTALALVVTIALFDTISTRLRTWIGGQGRDRGYERLLRALGQSLLTAQRPELAIDPALARLARTFRLTGAEATGSDGQLLARHGEVADSPLALRLPLLDNDATYGTVTFGPKRTLLPFSSSERALLRLAAGYLAASLRLGERQEEQAEALDTLSRERTAVANSGTALHEALAETATARAPGLRVFALGPLRVEREGELIRQWGGEKAGTRQAEALFAFLFDRGERGVSKDEVTELIWPDVDLDRSDVAFHRTMGGLRRTLDPARRPGADGTAIVFHNDRYRLDPSLIAWSDLDVFAEHLAAASAAADADGATSQLMEARALYRGDYLDDCPFYGDSAHVEDRRALLRGRYVDLLLALAERHETRGDRRAAAEAFREARHAAGDDCPPAEAGLARLGVPVRV